MTARGDRAPGRGEWPAEDVAVLRRMWAQGHTGTQIANALGGRYSRNAVQGKVDRLGLASRPHKGGHAAPLRVRVEVKAKPAKKPNDLKRGRPVNPRGKPSTVEPKPLPPAPIIHQSSLNIAFPELQRGQCQFATSPHDVRHHRFCGHPVEPQRPFCPAHCAMSYTAPKT